MRYSPALLVKSLTLIIFVGALSFFLYWYTLESLTQSVSMPTASGTSPIISEKPIVAVDGSMRGNLVATSTNQKAVAPFESVVLNSAACPPRAKAETVRETRLYQNQVFGLQLQVPTNLTISVEPGQVPRLKFEDKAGYEGGEVFTIWERPTMKAQTFSDLEQEVAKYATGYSNSTMVCTGTAGKFNTVFLMVPGDYRAGMGSGPQTFVYFLFNGKVFEFLASDYSEESFAPMLNSLDSLTSSTSSEGTDLLPGANDQCVPAGCPGLGCNYETCIRGDGTKYTKSF